MAEPEKFAGANVILRAPEGAENVSDLHVFNNGFCSVSCWALSAEELAEITRTGVVYLSVFMGKTQPPVYVGSEATVRDMVADYGVWRRE